MKNVVLFGDCLVRMQEILNASVDMILCDLPYGTTACKWDVLIPFEPLWEQYERIIKPSGAIVLTASQPFTSLLVSSNLSWFKYCWVWDKVKPVGHLVAKYRPMQRTEDIAVFGNGRINYYPKMTKHKHLVRSKEYGRTEIMGGTRIHPSPIKYLSEKNPQNVLVYSNASHKGKVHPTQKPVELFSYLIETYTKPGDLVLDNCAGSGTTGVACIQTGRSFILIEKDRHYFSVCRKRIIAASKGESS